MKALSGIMTISELLQVKNFTSLKAPTFITPPLSHTGPGSIPLCGVILCCFFSPHLVRVILLISKTPTSQPIFPEEMTNQWTPLVHPFHSPPRLSPGVSPGLTPEKSEVWYAFQDASYLAVDDRRDRPQVGSHVLGELWSQRGLLFFKGLRL